MKSTRLSIMMDVIVRSPEAGWPEEDDIAMEVLMVVTSRWISLFFRLVEVFDIVACAEPTLLAGKQMSMGSLQMAWM